MEIVRRWAKVTETLELIKKSHTAAVRQKQSTWTVRPGLMRRACRLDKRRTTKCHIHHSKCEERYRHRKHLHLVDACRCRKARCPRHTSACGCNRSRPNYP